PFARGAQVGEVRPPSAARRQQSYDRGSGEAAMAARRGEAGDLSAVSPAPQGALADAKQPARFAEAEPGVEFTGLRLGCGFCRNLFKTVQSPPNLRRLWRPPGAGYERRSDTSSTDS